MTALYLVSKECGCLLMRTTDKQEAIQYAAAHGLIFDVVTIRSAGQEAREMGREIGCRCEGVKDAEW